MKFRHTNRTNTSPIVTVKFQNGFKTYKIWSTMPREYDGDTDCVQPRCDVNFKCKLIGFDFRSDMFVVKSASLIVNAIILQLNFLIS